MNLDKNYVVNALLLVVFMILSYVAINFIRHENVFGYMFVFLLAYLVFRTIETSVSAVILGVVIYYGLKKLELLENFDQDKTNLLINEYNFDLDKTINKKKVRFAPNTYKRPHQIVHKSSKGHAEIDMNERPEFVRPSDNVTSGFDITDDSLRYLTYSKKDLNEYRHKIAVENTIDTVPDFDNRISY